ncbi:DUF3313 family protein [Pelagicoccus mobilis]|uniref:DUF3313 domain-containing protein n=1 Tax=Pelagicoccus mobilis TaxID=415221 RepID=A0A934VRG6_9BACT|nr:DUF3313 family protein [Pelagicoccus mobilis]MBK1877598.1 DUF3313 domain-containing protein [Pelagicoccus mobilis]
MKTMIKILTQACICIAILATPITAEAKKKKFPDVSFDGLEKVERPKSKADAVYIQPGADLSGYKSIIVAEPQIAFRKYWKEDHNSGRMADRIDDKDMERMISRGKKLFIEQFTKTLTKKGYPVVHAPEGNVLVARAGILNLDVEAPDPNRTAGTWSKVYTEYAGSATLVIELYDSTSGQLLARAIDHKDDIGEQFGWYQDRTQFTNINDAREAFDSWARMLANGLDEAKKG